MVFSKKNSILLMCWRVAQGDGMIFLKHASLTLDVYQNRMEFVF